MYSGGAQTAPPSLASLVFPGSCCSGGLPASKPSHLGRKAPQPPPVSLWAKAAISSAHLVIDRPHLRLRQPKSVHVPDELSTSVCLHFGTLSPCGMLPNIRALEHPLTLASLTALAQGDKCLTFFGNAGCETHGRAE